MKTLMITAVAALALGVAAPALASTARMDTNGDGKVSRQEMEQRKIAQTMKLDANHDGRLSKAEFAARMMVRFEGKGMTPAQAQAKIDRLFAKTDLNHDGFLTPDEIKATTDRRFARMDPTGSGYIPATTGNHRQPAPPPPAPPSAPR